MPNAEAAQIYVVRRNVLEILAASLQTNCSLISKDNQMGRFVNFRRKTQKIQLKIYIRNTLGTTGSMASPICQRDTFVHIPVIHRTISHLHGGCLSHGDFGGRRC